VLVRRMIWHLHGLQPEQFVFLQKLNAVHGSQCKAPEKVSDLLQGASQVKCLYPTSDITSW
jgi:hypothetical protein